jgi:AraC-like DNA-binding protein
MKMEKQSPVNLLPHYQKSLEKFQLVIYKDLYLNGTGFRVLGVTLINHDGEWNIKPHKHTFFEYHYVTEGIMYTSLNGFEFPINPRNFYIIPPDTLHSHRQPIGTTHAGFSFRWEFFKGNQSEFDCGNATAELDQVKDGFIHAVLKPLLDEDDTVWDQIKQLLELGLKESGLLELQLEFIRLLLGITRLYAGEHDNGYTKVNSLWLENRTAETALRFIEENYNQEIDVHDVAKSVYLSYSHLSRVFKEHYGETIGYSLNKVRLRKAQHLLLCSEQSVGQVAENVGFQSEQHFCKLFKKFYGISPGAYRIRREKLSE